MNALDQEEIERHRVIDEKFIVIEQRFAEMEQKIESTASGILHKVCELGTELKANTEVTTQVRDVLTSFKVLGSVSKWSTGVGALALMLWHAWQKFTGKM